MQQRRQRKKIHTGKLKFLPLQILNIFFPSTCNCPCWCGAAMIQIPSGQRTILTGRPPRSQSRRPWTACSSHRRYSGCPACPGSQETWQAWWRLACWCQSGQDHDGSTELWAGGQEAGLRPPCRCHSPALSPCCQQLPSSASAARPGQQAGGEAGASSDPMARLSHL